MASLRIHPLHLGTITRPKIIFCFGLGELDKVVEAPLIAWYIEGADKKILVDTGGAEPSAVPFRAPYVRKEEQTVDQALKRVGVGCEDIDIVILTHLHWDHCSNIDLFPKARIIVQEQELKTARSPLPLMAGGYDTRIVQSDRFEVISGDRKITDGVSVVLTPGHTYGSQGVTVDAETQRYFIAGDTVALFECTPPIISGVYVDMRLYYESFEKMARLSATTLPGHDTKVFDREVYR
jgi:glyoxylase-like metal-dependent hydrolase (beta-lactamase superfamily II)